MSEPLSPRPDDLMFRGLLVLTANLVISGVSLVFFIAILASMLADQHGSLGVGAVIPALAIPLSLAFGFRQIWAPSVTIRPDELVYRSTYRTRHIPRDTIVSLSMEKTRLPGEGVIRRWYPRLVLTDGSTISLRDMRAGIQGSIDGPDRYNDNSQRLIAAVEAWLNQPRPTPPIAPIG